MILENKYLTKAIQKAGYVVIVKTCHRKDKKSKLEYISPNANMFGMNVELLNKGMKLTEDYIHPEDRSKVISTVLMAIESNVKDYVHEYRMVGDDGQLYNVSNEICVSNVQDDKFTVEFYIRNEDKAHDTDKVRNEGLSAHKKIKKSEDEKERLIPINIGEKITESKKLNNMFMTFAKLSKLYSVFVDINGSIVFPPTGPSTNLGDFYDLFEKPAYKEYYRYIVKVMQENNEPTILDREEGGLGKISAAPITINKEIYGYWILGSYTEEETENLKMFYKHQWETAELMSEYIYQKEVISEEVAKSKGVGAKLRVELERQNIINNALSKYSSKLIDSIDENIEDTLRDVGVSLNITSALMYVVKSSYSKQNRLRLYWNVAGQMPDESITEAIADRLYNICEQIEKNGIYFADGSNMTEQSKIALMRYNFKAVVGVPIYRNDELYCILFFGDGKSGRLWASDEIRFIQSIGIIVQNMLENAEGDDNVRRVNKHLIDTYNTFNVGVFVRDTYSGKVLFSNKKMNDMLGYDFEGGDSRTIITDLHDRFDGIGGMRKPFITKEKITNWRSYIKVLDGIMDITEIQIEWLDGEPASLIVLRKAKD